VTENTTQAAGGFIGLTAELDTGIARNKQLKQILNNVLSGIIKREDAPCSSETHLNMAVVGLLQLLPEFEANDGKADAILYAIGEQLIANKHSV